MNYSVLNCQYTSKCSAKIHKAYLLWDLKMIRITKKVFLQNFNILFSNSLKGITYHTTLTKHAGKKMK